VASVGKPRSYMIRSILSWSVVLNAEVKSTINAYVSCLKFLASSWVVMKF